MHKSKEDYKAYRRRWSKTPKGKLAAKRNATNRKRWAVRNRPAIRALQKRWRDKVKLEALTHYSAPIPICACCGEPVIAFLTIDHKDGDGAAHRRSLRASSKIGGTGFYFWLKKNGWPPGFQALCYNCNIGKRNGSECPHKLLAANHQLTKIE